MQSYLLCLKNQVKMFICKSKKDHTITNIFLKVRLKLLIMLITFKYLKLIHKVFTL